MQYTINIASSNYISAFFYGFLVWGSKIENGHPLHLPQNKAMRIVANYIAHSEPPICKALNLVKDPDMYMYTCAA